MAVYFRNGWQLSAEYAQAKLSQKLGIKQSILAYYEKGKRKPSISTLLKIAEMLYVDIYDLLGLKKTGKPGPSSIIQKQLEEIKNLPISKQKRILESLDDMLKGAKQKVS